MFKVKFPGRRRAALTYWRWDSELNSAETLEQILANQRGWNNGSVDGPCCLLSEMSLPQSQQGGLGASHWQPESGREGSNPRR